MNAPMIQVGASVEAIAEGRRAILDIITSQNSDQVKLAAVEVLATICETKQTVINGNVFHGETKE